MSKLFSPPRLRELTVRNRVFVSPMCLYSSEDGFPTEWHLVHLAGRAVGSAGLVMQETTGVSSVGRISPWDVARAVRAGAGGNPRAETAPPPVR
jgi:2,4-dienoyl-CoA reductase-like NADH-dependent reductase (Old Yellow Enzyme family)